MRMVVPSWSGCCSASSSSTEERSGYHSGMADASTQLLIDGELRDAAAGRTFTTYDPARGGELAQVAQGGADDVDAAVDRGPRRVRGRMGEDIAGQARAGPESAGAAAGRADRCARRARESRNNGKAKWQCAAEIKVAVATLELFAGTAQHLYGRSHVVNPSVVSYTLREPVGVVGAIIPWNYPLMMAAWKVAPALAAGNTLILKPASATPLSAIRLGELALEAGIPAGVLNVVPGPGAEVGEAIATPPGHRQGRLHRRDGHRPSHRGGRRRDAEARLAGARREERRTSSLPMPISTRPSRLAVGDLLLGRTVVRGAIPDPGPGRGLRRVRIGLRGEGEGADGGRSAGRRRRRWARSSPARMPTKVRGLHRDRPRGRRRAAGRRRPRRWTTAWMPMRSWRRRSSAAWPTTARIAQEEVFGPVVTLTRFADEAEAVRLANDVRYGLAATVWTGDGGARPSRGAADPLRRGRHQHAVRRVPRRPVRRVQGLRLRPRAVARGARPVHRDEGRPPGHVAEAGESVRGLTWMTGTLGSLVRPLPRRMVGLPLGAAAADERGGADRHAHHRCAAHGDPVGRRQPPKERDAQLGGAAGRQDDRALRARRLPPRRHDRHLRAWLVGGVRLARRDPGRAPATCSSTR